MNRGLQACIAVVMLLWACTPTAAPFDDLATDADWVACVESADADPDELAAAGRDDLQDLLGDPVVLTCTTTATDTDAMAEVLAVAFDPVPWADDRADDPTLTARHSWLLDVAAATPSDATATTAASTIGEVLAGFDALDGLDEVDGADALDRAAFANAEQNRLAITLWTALEGPPEGMAEWIEDNGFSNDPNAELEWLSREADQGTTVFNDIDLLARTIDEVRDEDA